MPRISSAHILTRRILADRNNVDISRQAKCQHNAQWRKQGIREIKVCKKCPKVNPYCDAICDPILIKPFLDGAK